MRTGRRVGLWGVATCEAAVVQWVLRFQWICGSFGHRVKSTASVEA